ncbi:hypothetical protein FRC0043_00520 [Corynebacterium belfantii]|nr:hypothetical protein FRC0043_00520 [Corynebacterium belfantii]
MPRPTPNTSALSVFGLGTFLLLMWRFIPLPWPVSLALLSAAAGSLAAGVGLVCQDSHHWRRHAALGVALAAAGFILFEVAPQSAESLPIAFGLVIAFSCTLSWCPRWAIVPAIAFAVAFDCAQLHDDRPRPDPNGRYTGHRVKAVAPARHNAGNCTLRVGCGFPGVRGVSFSHHCGCGSVHGCESATNNRGRSCNERCCSVTSDMEAVGGGGSTRLHPQFGCCGSGYLVRFYLSDVHTNIRLARVRDSPAPNIRSAG